ncbi:transposase [Herpetosiphon gulosus]|uniref:transposase n=1 Tax=Herpetosiphon gulosus TaxID=1973496 RepID=UPI0031E60608
MPSAAVLALADWNVVMTNAPRTLLSPTEVWALVRVRWQIELLFKFKLWKSHARIDDWHTANPARVLCEIYAKLIGLVFQQWLLAASSWHDPEGLRQVYQAPTRELAETKLAGAGRTLGRAVRHGGAVLGASVGGAGDDVRLSARYSAAHLYHECRRGV